MKPASKWQKKTQKSHSLRPIESKLRKEGKKLYNLTSGDPVVWGHSNQQLSKYLIEAAEQGYHSYGGPANSQGLPATPPLPTQLINGIIGFEKKLRDVEYNPNDIVYGNGCASVIWVVHQALLEEGDEVLSFEPAHYFIGPTSYFPYLGAKVISCESNEEEGWKPELDQLRKKITDKTKMIVINNPNNPTGAVYSEKVLKDIIDIAGEHGLLIMSDEIYSLITFDGVTSTSTAALAGDVPVITLNGLAKFFMRTGWKVGYGAFHDPDDKIGELKDTIKKVWRVYGSQRRSMSTPMLYAAAKAFNDTDAGWKFVKDVKKGRDYSIKRVNEIDGLSCVDPQGTFYIFPKIEVVGDGRKWESDVDFLSKLAHEHYITLDPGIMYGEKGFGHFRAVTCPSIEVLEHVYNKIEEFIKK